MFQPTHPVWGATIAGATGYCFRFYFNPRTPCGVRPNSLRTWPCSRIFQSTHLVWGATRCPDRVSQMCEDFNPRTPCGVRRGIVRMYNDIKQFQSTHPVWGATSSDTWGPWSPMISIHAPRVGCDEALTAWRCRRPPDFNPRTPCGVRLVKT